MGLSKLSDDEIQESLKELNGWTLQNGKLHKEIEFSDFDAAWNFMTIAVGEIQKMNHHPEWFNVYKTVEVTLKTHDVNSLSDLDKKLSEKMDFFLLNN